MRNTKDYRLDKMLDFFKLGKVYRTSELAEVSNNLSRDLEAMVKQGLLVRPSSGMYYKPKKEWFGTVPVESDKILAKFLNTKNFLVVNRNNYNSLGLGTTQLHNRRVVYNTKRHGLFKLDGQTYEFKKQYTFPKKVSREFLLIDMFNNFKHLGEDLSMVKISVKKNWDNFETKKLLSSASKFGKISTQKFFIELAKDNNVSS